MKLANVEEGNNKGVCHQILLFWKFSFFTPAHLQLSLLTPPTAVNFNNVSSSGRPQLKLDCEYIMQSNLLFEHLFLW